MKGVEYTEMIITKRDYENYLKGIQDFRIDQIWCKLLNKLSDNLRQEAIAKGFKLKEVNRAMDLINLIIEVPEASIELKYALLDLNPFIICE